jgi:hypothetical protein
MAQFSFWFNSIPHKLVIQVAPPSPTTRALVTGDHRRPFILTPFMQILIRYARQHWSDPQVSLDSPDVPSVTARHIKRSFRVRLLAMLRRGKWRLIYRTRLTIDWCPAEVFTEVGLFTLDPIHV